MEGTNSVQFLGLIAIIAGIVIISNLVNFSPRDNAVLLIGGLIFVIGLFFLFSSRLETIIETVPGKRTLTRMTSRETKSNGEVITQEENTETRSTGG